jgi:hypothetical protein
MLIASLRRGCVGDIGDEVLFCSDGVDFDVVAREWRLKWSSDGENKVCPVAFAFCSLL